MKKIILSLVFFLLLMLVIAEISAAAYIKFDGIDGESKDSNHDTWSDLTSFQQGITQPGRSSTGPSRRRGAVVLSEIEVVKEIDKASPKIAEAICKGKNFPKVEVDFARPINQNNSVYYSYELTNAKITDYSIVGSEDSGIPPVDGTNNYIYGNSPLTEKITIVFEEIEVKYIVYDDFGLPIGEIGYFWDKFFDI